MNENPAPVKNRTIIVGLVLIAIGLLFIIGKYLNLGGLGRLWPLFMLIPVATLSSSLIQDPRKNAGAAIPAVILTVLAVLFLWLNYTDWERLSSAWPMFVVAPGLGVLASGLISKERGQLSAAGIILAVGLALFARIAMNRLGVHVDRIVLLGIVLVVSGVLVLVLKNRGKGNPKG